MRTLAVVPARGGSRGLPGKNARPFLGVPLLTRAVQVALETCDDLVVTTDAPSLARIAREAGATLAQTHHRPDHLATDDAPMLPVVQDAIRGREGDVVVLLQPTQPLRTAAQVRLALSLLSWGWDSVVSVRAIPQTYSPDRVLAVEGHTLRDPHDPDMFLGDSRRQDARQGYLRDGTVYVTRRRVIEDSRRPSLYGDPGLCRALILPGDALSIDTLEDFERLEALARQEIIREDLAKEA